MGRIIAIDYGTKRVGIAVTDRLQMIATALTTVHANDLLTFLSDYLQKEPVDKIVFGQPFTLNDEPSSVEPHIQGFIKRLRKQHPEVEIDREDERFTSKMAQESLYQSGMSKKKRQQKGQLDQTSAVIILQSYLGHV